MSFLLPSTGKKYPQFILFASFLTLGLGGCSVIADPEPPKVAVRQPSGSNAVVLDEVVVTAPRPGEPTGRIGGGGGSGGYTGGGYGGYGGTGYGYGVGSTSGGTSSPPPTENTGPVENATGTIGDYAKVCKVQISPTIVVRVLVEATINANPPKIEKLSVYASGITPLMTFAPIGEGTGFYDVVNNAFHFTAFYQITGGGSISTREQTLTGIIYLNTGTYVLRNQP